MGSAFACWAMVFSKELETGSAVTSVGGEATGAADTGVEASGTADARVLMRASRAILNA